MSEAETATPEVDEIDRVAKDDAALAKRWIAEIQASEKQQTKWVERAKKIEKIYCDDRDSRADRTRKFNILWSNVETLRPAVYMQTPKARAVRRYRDKDPEARFGALLIERGVETSCELYDFDHAMDQAVRDRLVVGRGQCWVFYTPGIVGQGDQAALAYEDVQADYVPWNDFLHSVSRTWSDVWWVGRWFYKSRAELKTWMRERGLDEARASRVAMDVSSEADKTDEGLKDERARARILEVWNKRDDEVLYVAPGSGVNAILGRSPPPVKFRDFFPCPRPMLATTTAKSLIPTPDYALYQDQAEELNRCSDRIGVLQKALKLVGVFNASNKELARLIEAADGTMIAVENWAMFAEGGKGAGNFEFFPIEQVAEVLKGLYEIRDQAKQTLYEVSGIGDILRGATDPDETATAQGIKAKWGSLRVRRIQKDTQRFASDIMRLKAEVITEQFKFQSVLAMAGVDQDLLDQFVPEPEVPPQLMQAAQGMPPEQVEQAKAQLMPKLKQMATQQFLQKVEALLKDDTARNFRIDVESDSALEPDLQEEKQTAVEFATSISAFLKEAAPLMMQGPEVADMIGETLLFVVRRFGNGTEALEKKIEAMVEAAKKPKPPAPDPEMEKVKAEIEGKKAELQMKQEGQKAELGMKREMHQLDMQATMQKVQVEGAAQAQKLQQDAVMGQQKMALQAQQGEQALQQSEQQGDLAVRQGEQKISLAERAQKAKEDIEAGGPPE